MDPITVIGLAASVTNLIHATRSVLRVIKEIRDTEKSVSVISNDILAFSEALVGFDRVLRSRHTVHRISGPVIQNVLDNSSTVIEKMEKRLAQITSSDISAVRRARWVQHRSAINKLHDRLKEQNIMLQTFLSITQTESFLAVASQNPKYNLICSPPEAEVGDNEQSESLGLLQVPSSRSCRRRCSNASSLATLDTISDTWSSTTGPLSQASSVTSFESTRNNSVPMKAAISGGSSDLTSSLINMSDGSSPAGVQFARQSGLALIEPPGSFAVRRSCRYDCHCVCHEHNPREHRRMLGRVKNTKIICTEAGCKNMLATEGTIGDRTSPFRQTLAQLLTAKSVKVRYDLNTYRMVSEGHEAIRYVKHGNLESLKACLESGKATKWDTAPDGWSLLHTAAYNRQLPIVKYLLELGSDLEVGDVGSRRPADFAFLKSIAQDATHVEQDILQTFTRNDDILSDFDFTPIHVVALGMYPPADAESPSLEELVQLVDDANNAPVNTNWVQWKLKYKGRSTLFTDVLEYFRASAFGESAGTKIIHNLLDRKDKKFSWTPLHWAASAGRVEMMKKLVAHGADPLVLSDLDANILHAAAESTIGRGLAGALEVWKQCSGRLDINQVNRWVETPLHVASWSSAACVKLLLEAGANPDVREENGQVPLHCAGLSGQGNNRREIVSLLCNSPDNAHINTQDHDGRPPMFDFLDDSESVEVLISCGAKLDLIDVLGKNVFHHACRQGENESLEVLLRLAGEETLAGAKDNMGNSPLIEALSYGNVESAMILLQLDSLGDAVSHDGWTPAHYAAKIGDLELMEAVLKNPGFRKGLRTKEGKSVEVIAMEAGNWYGTIKQLIRQNDYLAWRD
ncbi:MAG: hypothetical protein M1820_010147 [Bogoriella megaspora]|nr:MAG: hypothetical protein M1820_010147 [Bogoriella megaspora]